jgi:hypothetical protein
VQLIDCLLLCRQSCVRRRQMRHQEFPRDLERLIGGRIVWRKAPQSAGSHYHRDQAGNDGEIELVVEPSHRRFQSCALANT